MVCSCGGSGIPRRWVMAVVCRNWRLLMFSVIVVSFMVFCCGVLCGC